VRDRTAHNPLNCPLGPLTWVWAGVFDLLIETYLTPLETYVFRYIQLLSLLNRLK
jgi:hypothetical protein